METLTKRVKIENLQQVLKYTFGIIPIAAGADKFLNLLVDWEIYLPHYMEALLPFSPSVFMMIVGIIEIIAGILVMAKTEIGAYIVSAWLVLIALSLISSGDHFDIAVRDLGLAISAFILAKMTAYVEQQERVPNYA